MQNQVLAQSATKLTVSVTPESFMAALPTIIQRQANINLSTTGSAMRLERVNLNKQSLIAGVKREYLTSFPLLTEKGGDVPQDIYDTVAKAVGAFVKTTLARLNEGEWKTTGFTRGYAYSNRVKAFVQKQTATAELVIDLPEQKLAAGFALSEAKSKLKELEKKMIAPDDLRIVNAKKRVENALGKFNEVLAEIKAQAELADKAKAE